MRELAGPPEAQALLLLHGWTVTADLNWRGCYAPLAERYRVVAMDHRGHGRGIRSWRRFRLEDCADDAIAVADVLDLRRPILVGYSMGGPVACLAARRHRGRLGGIVLCATAARFLRGAPIDQVFSAGVLGLSLAARLTPGPLRRPVTDTFLRQRSGSLPAWARHELQRSDAAALLQAGFAVRTWDGAAWMAGLDLPCAVVVTERDGTVPPSAQLAMARSIPGSTVHTVPGDHDVVITSPEVLLGSLIEACASVASRAGARLARGNG
ncbi:MAG: alpha/beta fold hydrolase [Acidimicrobiales bacterium]